MKAEANNNKKWIEVLAPILAILVLFTLALIWNIVAAFVILFVGVIVWLAYFVQKRTPHEPGE